MLVKTLKAFFSQPLVSSVDPNSAEYHLIRARIVQNKPLLRRIYLSWYRILDSLIPKDRDGIVVEIGSSTSFSKQVMQGVITSDIVDTSRVDIVMDGQYLPFKDDTLRAIVMVDVFHHIPNVELFLRAATKCLKTGGVIAMIEPWATPWSALIYKYLHHEPFDRCTQSWRIQPGMPLTSSNQALPWIVFKRDRKIFEKKFQELKIASINLHSPFRYLLSGGISFRSLWPDKLFSLLRLTEDLLVPLNKYIAMFSTIVLKK